LHVPLPPLAQSTVPAVQGLPVSHAVPGMHSLQPSTPHAPATPQGVPIGTSSVMTHTGMPDPQSISPRVQGSPVSQT
jgi:hypothetical protein